MLSHHVADIAGAVLALTLLLAARPVFGSRPSSLRRSVGALRGWHVADRVQLSEDVAGTLDHVVVAPAALLAVTVTCHAPGLAELQAAEHGARGLRELARQAGVVDPAVVPVVSIRGADAPTDGHLVVDGVHLVDDAAPQAWLRQFRDARIPAVSRIALARAVDRQVASPRHTRGRHADVVLARPEPAGA